MPPGQALRLVPKQGKRDEALRGFVRGAAPRRRRSRATTVTLTNPIKFVTSHYRAILPFRPLTRTHCGKDDHFRAKCMLIITVTANHRGAKEKERRRATAAN